MVHTTKDLLAELRTNRYTADFSEQELHVLSKFCDVYMVDKGQTILKAGELNQSIFLVSFGEIGVYHSNNSHDHEELVHRLTDNDYFGEAALSEEQLEPFTNQTHKPTMLIKVNIHAIMNDREHQELYIHLLHKRISDHSERKIPETLLENDRMMVVHTSEERKRYQALGKLASRLLIALSIYTLLLVSLTDLVATLGASTIVDVTLLIGFALMIYFIIKSSGFPLRSFGLRIDNWKQEATEAVKLTLPVLGFFMVLKWVLITFVPSFSHMSLFNVEAAFADTGFTVSLFIMTIFIYIVFSVVQEFVARVGLQSAFEKFLPHTKAKMLKAILLSNLLFAVAHSHIGLVFALAAFIPGLYWGWLFARQRSLVGVSISHMLIGIWVLFLLGYPEFLQ
ncbi:CPBP family glutamic-type intramembrane protease [Desertibacillus haloalkaliphilus]|uniref:CPBP family glutamic-type intramembrane protease n=1 Tax=Desertibacillus haloalkaliphilus TaxID=1328930 RepID=UPI001C27EB02|nr:CPBP family glutamic-type intramembrane protease [Desertibacillus haloalkaliphilus]MBU8907928.1 CPBP family intramembrane metalloprotease [Desertibacillus haloalkaliphilus]